MCLIKTSLTIIVLDGHSCTGDGYSDKCISAAHCKREDFLTLDQQVLKDHNLNHNKAADWCSAIAKREVNCQFAVVH